MSSRRTLPEVRVNSLQFSPTGALTELFLMKKWNYMIDYITGSPSSIYEKLKFLLTSVLSRSLRDLHIYKDLYGERNIAENCKNSRLNFNINCLITWTPVVLLSHSVWFSSGFVAFPSSYSSIVCCLIFRERANGGTIARWKRNKSARKPHRVRKNHHYSSSKQFLLKFNSNFSQFSALFLSPYKSL